MNYLTLEAMRWAAYPDQHPGRSEDLQSTRLFNAADILVQGGKTLGGIVNVACLAQRSVQAVGRCAAGILGGAVEGVTESNFEKDVHFKARQFRWLQLNKAAVDLMHACTMGAAIPLDLVLRVYTILMESGGLVQPEIGRKMRMLIQMRPIVDIEGALTERLLPQRQGPDKGLTRAQRWVNESISALLKDWLEELQEGYWTQEVDHWILHLRIDAVRACSETLRSFEPILHGEEKLKLIRQLDHWFRLSKQLAEEDTKAIVAKREIAVQKEFYHYVHQTAAPQESWPKIPPETTITSTMGGYSAIKMQCQPRELVIKQVRATLAEATIIDDAPDAAEKSFKKDLLQKHLKEMEEFVAKVRVAGMQPDGRNVRGVP